MQRLRQRYRGSGGWSGRGGVFAGEAVADRPEGADGFFGGVGGDFAVHGGGAFTQFTHGTGDDEAVRRAGDDIYARFEGGGVGVVGVVIDGMRADAVGSEARLVQDEAV